MSRWLLVACFCLANTGFAAAQVGNGVNSGINSDNGAISGPNIDRVNGINANGTPRQQSPGSSMTNGAGNSAMTPGITGAPTHKGIINGIVIPTINGEPAPPNQ
jgi:hypothetical protein